MMRTFIFFVLLSTACLQAEGFSWRSGDDLTIDLVAAHPVVEQSIFLNFDHRGRMWVAQYRQYPFPAGSKVVGKDRFWRSEYDKLPLAPGHSDYVPGKDRISIHEDTNGDGSFDKVTPFLDGLNFCTSFAHDHDGLWVLQPPYLLFYEDKDRDDQPDGPPQVHLRGFGIEDSHSLSNSLSWGPDGWLYGANGSTTSLRVAVEGKQEPPVVRAGQLIWRYHPKKRVFEIFAEGGGNNLSCEFDSVGQSNASARLAFTDPNDPNDVLKISEWTQTVNEISVTWPTVAGVNYQLLWSADLTSWNLVSDHTGTGQPETTVIEKPDLDSSPRVFLRVAVAL